HAEKEAVTGDPRVVHQVVDAAERLQRVFRRGRDRGRVREIDGERAAPGAPLFALPRDALERISVPGEKHEIGPPRRELQRNGAADAPRRPSDQTDPLLELAQVHPILPTASSTAAQALPSVVPSSTFNGD